MSDNAVNILEYQKLIHDLKNGLSSTLMQAQLLLLYAEAQSMDGGAVKKSAEAIEQNIKEVVALLDQKLPHHNKEPLR